MNDQKIDNAITILGNCKQKKMSYYDATQELLKLGYSEAEIRQAAYTVKYHNNVAIDKQNSTNTLDQALAEGIVQERYIEDLKEQSDEATIISVFFRKNMIVNHWAIARQNRYLSAKTGKSLRTVWLSTYVLGFAAFVWFYIWLTYLMPLLVRLPIHTDVVYVLGVIIFLVGIVCMSKIRRQLLFRK